jgi:hypothetical protein
VLATGGGAQYEEAPNEDKRQDVSDTVRIAMAATCASPKPAPATKANLDLFADVAIDQALKSNSLAHRQAIVDF